MGVMEEEMEKIIGRNKDIWAECPIIINKHDVALDNIEAIATFSYSIDTFEPITIFRLSNIFDSGGNATLGPVLCVYRRSTR